MESKVTPKKWKIILLNWLFVYPVINLLFILLWPSIKELPQLIKTLILTGILVPAMAFTLPLLHKKFYPWLIK